MRNVMVLLFAIAGACHATAVIDFESDFPIPTMIDGSQTVTGEGFRFALVRNIGTVLIPVGGCNPECVRDGTYTLGATNGTGVIVSAADSSPFSLYSFQAASLFAGPAQNAMSITVTAFLSEGGQVSHVFDVADANTFVVYTLPAGFTDLSSVQFQWTGSTPYSTAPSFQLDNIVVSPEPASVWLCVGGVLLLLAARRRHNRERVGGAGRNRTAE